MAYDGRIMRQALARFEEDKQRREADFNQRRRRLYDAEPRLRPSSAACSGVWRFSSCQRRRIPLR